MKAWYVYIRDPDDGEIWDVTWADTRGKAKMKSPFWPTYGVHEIGARRLLTLDGKCTEVVNAADLIRAGIKLTCVWCDKVVTARDIDAGKLRIRGWSCWHNECWER